MCIEPSSSDIPVITDCEIFSTISKHAASTAILLLPGIQYYTGQLLDIAAITAFAHKHGIFVIWDLAHAVGNVPLKLHEWDVDAAVWCSYKYLNSGPGCIGGLFIHERHSRSDTSDTDSGDGSKLAFSVPKRLGGWWGNSKSTRFAMATIPGFQPVSGAAGFQLSNPSVLDITSLCASLELFELVGGVPALRRKSLQLTGYLESLLTSMPSHQQCCFSIITPRDPEQRGAQLSILLLPINSSADMKVEKVDHGRMLNTVMKGLENHGVIVDERQPNVIRVAPVPLYNTFSDVFSFVEAFGMALDEAAAETE